jgi:hypothetical protein
MSCMAYIPQNSCKRNYFVLFLNILKISVGFVCRQSQIQELVFLFYSFIKKILTKWQILIVHIIL